MIFERNITKYNEIIKKADGGDLSAMFELAMLYDSSLAYQNNDGTFSSMADFSKTDVNVYKITYFSSNIQTNTSATNTFAACTHYRTAQFDSSASEYTALVAIGCGVGNKKPSAALAVALRNHHFSSGSKNQILNSIFFEKSVTYH